ncbi:MAG: glycosyltransferase family 39 protein, partial [Pyrinomonadaceae bacterium]|nr:glycosyltransferase family 39 protein [Pyrinomonadaceae bacterium]
MNRARQTTSTPETADVLNSNHKSVAGAPHAVPLPSFWAARFWWLPPALISVALTLYYSDPFIGDWDGIDYTILSLAGYPSSMALGRNLFIFGNHALYQVFHTLFNVPPENAYLIFKYAVAAQVPLAVVACWILAREVSSSLYSATLAALFIVFSPIFILYGGQVMTDVPSVLLLAVALIIHLRGIQQRRTSLLVIAAALLGLGVNLRETMGFYAVWLALAPFALGWKLQRRELRVVGLSLVVFVVLALGWFGYWFLTDPHYRTIWFGWRESMRQESARHPVSISNAVPYVMYFFISAPLVFLALPFAAIREWRQRKLSPLLLLGLMGLLADLLLFLNYSTTINWRYFLTGLPALAPLTADYLIHLLTRLLGSARLAFASCLAVLVALGVVFGLLIRPVSQEFIERRAMSKQYRQQLVRVPRDAVMISGAQTIAVVYWKAIGAGAWETIGTGGGWPGDNLIPMALVLPNARFVGIDLSGRQIEQGQRQVSALGLTNIELRRYDIADIDASWGKFDYIISHGIYSWIPAPVRERLLAICRD